MKKIIKVQIDETGLRYNIVLECGHVIILGYNPSSKWLQCFVCEQ